MTYKSITIAVAVLAALLLSIAAGAVPDWMIRPGTVGHALTQPDGTRVYLDAVRIDKNVPQSTPPYFVVDECFNKNDRIIVLAELPSEFRLFQTIDVEGTLYTQSNGNRAIINPKVYAYLDRNGRLLYYGPLIKGVFQPTDWQWKQVFTLNTSLIDMRTTPLCQLIISH